MGWARSYPAVAVRSEDHRNPPARQLGDTDFEDALGEFTIRKRRRPETGSVLGVWIEVWGLRAWFEPHGTFARKLYQPQAPEPQ